MNHTNYLLKYLEKLKLKIDIKEFNYQLTTHPNSNTLLSISDTLNFFNIKNNIYKVSKEELNNLPTFFVLRFKDDYGNHNFHLIEKTDSETFFYYEDSKRKKIKISQIYKVWSDIVLVINQDYTKVEYDEKLSVKNLFFVISLLVIFCFCVMKNEFNRYSLFFLTLPFLGVLVSLLSFKNIFTIQNNLIKNICNISNLTDCDKIINSKKLKIFEVINFSDLSLVFFISQFLYFSYALFAKNELLHFESHLIIILLSMPFILISLYYQKFIEKKWCPICLMISFIMLSELILVSLIVEKLNINLNFIFYFTLIFYVSYFIWIKMKNILSVNKSLKEENIRNVRFIKNYDFFKNNLRLSKKNILPNNPLKIGKDDSKIKLTFILSPFCFYCKDVHNLIEKLLDKDLVDLQISLIITTNIKKDNVEYVEFYRNLHKIFYYDGFETFFKSYNDWYRINDLKIWNGIYGKVDFENNIVDRNLNLLNEWCISNNYNFTPVLFINEYEYPKEYLINNIEHYLYELIEDKDFV